MAIEDTLENIDEYGDMVYASAKKHRLSLCPRLSVTAVQSSVSWLQGAVEAADKSDILYALTVLFRNSVISTSILEGTHFMLTDGETAAVEATFNESFMLTAQLQGMFTPDQFHEALARVCDAGQAEVDMSDIVSDE